MATLHDTDFYSWTREQAEVLRRAADLRLNAPDGADWGNLAQEIWELGLSLENELYARYEVLLCHLLKWESQPNFRSGSWRGTVVEQRRRIARLLRKNPGLAPRRAEEYADAYAGARQRAAVETGFALSRFPTDCPYSLHEAEGEGFWPGPPVSLEGY